MDEAAGADGCSLDAGDLAIGHHAVGHRAAGALAHGHQPDPPSPGLGAECGGVTAEGKAAIRRFLDGDGGVGVSRGTRAAVWMALKLAATLLLVAGVGIAVGDGNEFDNVDCGVAGKPPGYCNGPDSGKRPGGQPPCPGGQAPDGGGSCSPSGLGAVLAGLPLNCFGVLADGHRAVVKAVEVAMARFEDKLEAVAWGNWELRMENEELRTLQKDGFFKFALRVDGEDFRAFAVIMALGNRKAAADFLKVPHRSFYDRVEKWSGRGRDYQRMARFIDWRKRSSRRIKLRLEDSVQSGEPNDEPENPETVGDVLEAISAGDNRDYPAVLGQVMEALKAQNVKNWPAVRDELVEMIKEEVCR